MDLKVRKSIIPQRTHGSVDMIQSFGINPQKNSGWWDLNQLLIQQAQEASSMRLDLDM